MYISIQKATFRGGDCTPKKKKNKASKIGNSQKEIKKTCYSLLGKTGCTAQQGRAHQSARHERETLRSEGR